MTDFEKTLKRAKEIAEEGKDCHLAVYMVRDFQELKTLGLDDLAWSLHKEGYVNQNDARGFFENVDHAIKAYVTNQEFIKKYAGEPILSIHLNFACQPTDSPLWQEIREAAQNQLESIRQECIKRMDNLDAELNAIADKWYSLQASARMFRRSADAQKADSLGQEHRGKHATWWRLSRLFDEMT